MTSLEPTDVGNGEFAYITDEFTRKKYVQAHKAISDTNNWAFMATFVGSYLEVTRNETYDIQCRMDILNRDNSIDWKYDYYNLRLTMRVMRFIAKEGENAYKMWYLRQ